MRGCGVGRTLRLATHGVALPGALQVEPPHGWLLENPTLRAATHGVALPGALQVEPRHAWLRCGPDVALGHPRGGSTRRSAGRATPWVAALGPRMGTHRRTRAPSTDGHHARPNALSCDDQPTPPTRPILASGVLLCAHHHHAWQAEMVRGSPQCRGNHRHAALYGSVRGQLHVGLGGHAGPRALVDPAAARHLGALHAAVQITQQPIVERASAANGEALATRVLRPRREK